MHIYKAKFGAISVAIKNIVLSIVIAGLGWLSVSYAYAYEELDFKRTLNKRSEYLIKQFAQENFENIEVAKADLNKDGLDELILKTGDCHASAEKCSFEILAETHNQLIRLGTVKARNILLGDQYSSGVRNILVFEDEANDYNYELYVWEPQSSRYIVLEKGL